MNACQLKQPAHMYVERMVQWSRDLSQVRYGSGLEEFSVGKGDV